MNRPSRDAKILLSIFGPIAVLFLALIFFQFKTFKDNTARIEGQLFTQQHLITKLAASRMQTYIREIFWKLEQSGGAVSASHSSTAQSEQVSRAFDALQDRVDGIAYFDAEGRKRHSVFRPGAMESLPAEGKFEEFFSTPRRTMVPYISPMAKAAGGERVYFSTPVRKADTGEFAGVMLAQVGKDSFDSLCGKLTELDVKMRFCYYDQQGQQLCTASCCDLVLGPGHKEMMTGADVSEILESPVAGEDPGQGTERLRLLFTPLDVEGYHWYVSSSMSLSGVDKMARGDLMFQLGIGAFFILFLAGGGFYFVRVYKAKARAESDAAYQASLALQKDALAAEKDKLLAVLNSIPDGIMLLDREGKVIDANARIRDVLGVSPKGRLAEDLEDMPEEFPIKALLGPIEGSAERVIGNKTYKLVSIPVTESGQGTLYEVRLMRDITLEKSLAQKKADLVSMITHDVKSPLTAIMGISQWLNQEKTDAPLGEDGKASLEAISRAANRILALMDNFLFLSSIEEVRRLRKEPVDLNTFLNKALLEFYLQAKSRDIKLAHHLADPAPTVHIDETQMMRAVANLISNALKYTPGGGEVSVSAKNFRNYVTITVADTGPGVNKKDMPFIFDRYYRSETTKKGVKGSGLGLAIAKAVVESHGGTIDVASEEGKGAVFTLRLPLADHPHPVESN